MKRPGWRTRPAPVDRTLGWLFSVGGVFLLIRELLRLGDQPQAFAPWWLGLAALVAALVVVLAVGGLIFPLPIIRVLWAATVVGGLLVHSSSLLAFVGPAPDTIMPFIWGFQPVTFLYALLLARAAVAVAVTVASALSPPLSALIVFGQVPHPVIVGALVYLSLVALTLVLAGLRVRLMQLSETERRARVAQVQVIEAEETLRAQRELALLLHDEVLSTLISAMNVRGVPPAVIREGAAEALTVLHSSPHTDADILVATVTAAEYLAGAVRVAAPDTEVSISVAPGEIPIVIVDAVRGAAAEAARNSTRHAATARRRATIDVSEERLRVHFADDGSGFDLSSLPPERLGLRESVLRRMRELEGGYSQVNSGGTGTAVEVGWIR